MTLISARSPYFIKRGSFDDGAVLVLNIGHTTSTAAFALLQSYAFTYRKETIINISPLIRDYLLDYDTLVINTTISGTSGGASATDVTGSFLATDGYSYYEDGCNKDYTKSLEDNGYYAGSNPVMYRNRDEPVTIPLINPNVTYISRNENDTTIKFYKGAELISTKTTDFGYGSPSNSHLLTDQRIQYITQDNPDSYRERVELDGGVVEMGYLSDIYDYLYVSFTPDKATITPPLFDRVLNGGFASDTIWEKQGTANISGGSGNLVGSTGDWAAFLQTDMFEEGKKYIITLDAVITSGLGVKLQDAVVSESIGVITETGSYTFNYTAGENTTLLIGRRADTEGFDSSIDNVTVKEVIGSYDIEIVPVDENKYTPYRVVFTNKYGVEEDLWFFKKSTSNIASTKENYRANTISSYASGDVSKHNIKTYNVNAKETITLNTGFIPESFSENIKQMMLSENTWVYMDSVKLPISIKNSESEMKKSVNDKLINYEIEIEFAYDIINNIG